MTAGANHRVVYEVNLEVEAAIAGEYKAWLDAHVAEMLALPGFVSAQVFEIDEPVETGHVAWCVHYLLRDTAALDAYLNDHAARMRADGQARFGDRFRASRRIMQAE